MRISDIHLTPSPSAPGRVRLGAQVRYQQGVTEQIYVEYPGECEPDIVMTGSPWLAMLLPTAFWFGEPIELDAPVDPELYWSVLHLLEIWRVWHGKPTIKVRAELLPRVTQPGTRIGAYLTGGVDSLFTALHSSQLDGGRYAPQDMICVAGMDIPDWHSDQNQLREQRLQKFCAATNKRFLSVRSNIRNGLAVLHSHYPTLSHAAMLAGVGLGLGRAYSHLLLSSSYLCKQPSLHVWGSHPVTDPMLSTTGTRLVHYGAAFRRTEKTCFIARSPDAMEALHVCFDDFAATNCGTCVKCLRTLACLDMFGALDRAKTFPVERYRPALLGGVTLKDDPCNIYFMTELLEMARERNRRDIERAIRYAFFRQSMFGLPDVGHRLGVSIRKRLGLYRKKRHKFPWANMPEHIRAELQGAPVTAGSSSAAPCSPSSPSPEGESSPPSGPRRAA